MTVKNKGFGHIKGCELFIYLIILALALKLSIDYLFVNKQLYYNTFSEQLSFGRIDTIFELSQKYAWIGIVLVPLILMTRIFFTSILLYIGTYFFEIKLEFKKIIKVALIADFIYIISGVFKMAVLVLYKNVSSLHDLTYTPLSIFSLFKTSSIDPVFVYPLSLLNAFELLYIFILALFLSIAIKESKELQPINYGRSLQLVVSSYGSGLLIWVLLVMFVSLNLG